MKRKPEWQFNDKEKEEHRHRMAKAVMGKKQVSVHNVRHEKHLQKTSWKSVMALSG